MKKTRLLLFLALCCAACSEPSGDPEIIIDPPADPILRAAHFYFTDQTHYRVEYQYGFMLEKEIERKENGDTLTLTAYKYDKYVRLIEQRMGTDPQAGIFTYQYNGDTLISAEYKDSAPIPQHFTRAYSYPDEKTVRIVEQNNVTKTVQHIYLYIEKNNIVRTKTLDPVTDQVIEEIEFEYDNYFNPYFRMTGKSDISRFYSPNNITVMRTRFRRGESVNSEVRYAYEYRGPFPIKKYQLLANNKRLLEQEYFY